MANRLNLDVSVDDLKASTRSNFAKLKDAGVDTLGKALNGGYTSLSDGGPNLIFPSDLGGSDGQNHASNHRPYIRFGCHSADGSVISRYICLACPPGIQFTDSAEYSSISMGKIAAIADMTRAGVEGYKSDGVMGAMGGALGSARDQILSGGSTGAAILAARALGADDIAQGLEFSSKTTINPRMNTAFTGNTLRTFSFSFKLIGSSAQEVDTIQQIQQYFQEQVYAEELGGQKVMLKYPNQWRIEFMHPDGYELTHIPKIYTTYLTSCATQINATGATFRRDMSPIEVDVALSFQETKILTRNELANLNNNSDRSNKDIASLSANINDLKGVVQNLYEKQKADSARASGAAMDPDNPKVPNVPGKSEAARHLELLQKWNKQDAGNQHDGSYFPPGAMTGR